MRHIFLHIGYPKVGSSALQTTLLASRADLRRAGFFFPNAPSGLCNAFTAHFHSEPQTLFPYCDLALPPKRLQRRMLEDFERLSTRLDRVPLDKAILSSESLIGLEANEVGRARDWLYTKAEQVTVVCYVRTPTSYASSLIQERVKQGQTLEEACNPYPTGNFSVWIPRWTTAFGKANVVVRSVHDPDLVAGDVAADFAATVGYEGPLSRVEQYDNRRLSQSAVLMLDAVNRVKGARNSKSPELMGLWRLPGPPFTPGADFLLEVSRRAQRQVDYLADEWGIRLPAPEPARLDDPVALGPESIDFLARWIVSKWTAEA